MNHRERVLKALSHCAVDRAPRDLGSSNVSSIHRYPYELLLEKLGIEDPEIRTMEKASQLVWPCEELLEAFDIDTRGISLSGAKISKGKVINDNKYIDTFGTTFERPENGLYFDVTACPLEDAETLEEVMEYQFPTLDELSSSDGVTERAKYLKEQTDYAIVGNFGSLIFMKVQQIRGYTQTLVDMSIDKEIAEYLLDKVLDLRIQSADRLIDACGDALDIIEMADDIAGQNGQLISTEMYRELVKPRTAKLISHIKSRCNAKILYHSCGDVYHLIEDLIDAGIDALNPIQVSAGNMSDIQRLKKEFGDRISFWGGIDSIGVLPTGTPEEVKNAVEQTVKVLGDSGGYVLCASHNIQPDVPIENILALYNKEV